MRIIAGEKRGMVLFSPKDQKIRPTSDKIKGAVFNSIQNQLSEDSIFVDAFGGSGAMGVEALSRGVRSAWFFDIARESIALIEKNVQKAGFGNRAEICHCTAEEGMTRLERRGILCDIVFMDPPYKSAAAAIELAETLQTKKLLKKDGIIMIEHDKNDIIPFRIKNLVQIKKKTYGITAISYYGFDSETDENNDEEG